LTCVSVTPIAQIVVPVMVPTVCNSVDGNTLLLYILCPWLVWCPLCERQNLTANPSPDCGVSGVTSRPYPNEIVWHWSVVDNKVVLSKGFHYHQITFTALTVSTGIFPLLFIIWEPVARLTKADPTLRTSGKYLRFINVWFTNYRWNILIICFGNTKK